jgi:hypothetical protein
MRGEIDGEDIEACGCGTSVLGQATEVDAGEAAEDALFFGVDGELGREGVAMAAGFDLDEAEDVAVPGDEVEVAAKLRGPPATGDDGVAGAAEVEEGFALAEVTGLKMSGGAIAVQGVKTADGPCLGIDPEACRSSSRGGG